MSESMLLQVLSMTEFAGNFLRYLYAFDLKVFGQCSKVCQILSLTFISKCQSDTALMKQTFVNSLRDDMCNKHGIISAMKTSSITLNCNDLYCYYLCQGDLVMVQKMELQYPKLKAMLLEIRTRTPGGNSEMWCNYLHFALLSRQPAVFEHIASYIIRTTNRSMRHKETQLCAALATFLLKDFEVKYESGNHKSIVDVHYLLNSLLLGCSYAKDPINLKYV